MSRAQRLLDVIQLLRSHRRPVAAGRLAEELRVSLRTIYRDIET
jgi:predicted DNA-binding transcriptional regulator YafY